MLDDILVKQGCILKIRLIPDWHPWALLPKTRWHPRWPSKMFFFSKEACFEFILPFNCTEMVISFGKLIDLHQYILYNHSSNVFTLLGISQVCNCKQKSSHIKRATRSPEFGKNSR